MRAEVVWRRRSEIDTAAGPSQWRGVRGWVRGRVGHPPVGVTEGITRGRRGASRGPARGRTERGNPRALVRACVHARGAASPVAMGLDRARGAAGGTLRGAKGPLPRWRSSRMTGAAVRPSGGTAPRRPSEKEGDRGGGVLTVR